MSGIIWSWCKHCKCRATGKVGFYTKHSSSSHTFPRRIDKTNPSEESPAPAVETPAASLTEVDDATIGDNEHSLAWEGFISPVEDVGETVVELIVGFGSNEAPPPPTLRIGGGGSGSESDDEESIVEGGGVKYEEFPPLAELFPHHHERYEADGLRRYVDFGTWMMWDDESVSQ